METDKATGRLNHDIEMTQLGKRESFISPLWSCGTWRRLEW